MSDKDNPHFDKIYWFIMVTTIISFAYIGAVTFLAIPKENQHIVDTVTGFLLGTVIGSAIGYLLGGNPTASRKAISILPPNSETQVTTASNEVKLD